MTGARRRLIVIDAANVVGSRPDGWWRDRAGAARRLIAKVTAYQAQLDEQVRLDGGAQGDDRPQVDADSNEQEGPVEPAAELVVVLEGAAKAALDRDHPVSVQQQAVQQRAGQHGNGSAGGRGGGGRVRVVAAAGSGDDAIVDVVAAALGDDGDDDEGGDDQREITVVTADRGLRERVEALGAQTVGPRWLWDRID